MATEPITPIPPVVAFDVDGTLVDFNDRPNRAILHALFNLRGCGAKIIVWSGGGKDYAESVGRRLCLPDDIEYRDKPVRMGETANGCVDLCFDDELVKFGRVNFKTSGKLTNLET